MFTQLAGDKMNCKVLLVAAASALVCAPASVYAGPLPHCTAATLSANHEVLVLDQLKFDDPDETHARKVQESIFQIFQRHDEINEHLRLVGPDTYWSFGPLWSVVFPHRDYISVCPYALVTNDAEFLVLVGNSPFDTTALRIYRRRDHQGQPFGGPGPDHGILIKALRLDQLCPPPLETPQTFTDESPQWYAYGSFAFSADNRTLVYKTASGPTVLIDLASGNIE